jgi:hypothetical protein
MYPQHHDVIKLYTLVSSCTCILQKNDIFYNVLCIVNTMILLNYMYTHWCRLVAYPEINLWGVTRYLF